MLSFSKYFYTTVLYHQSANYIELISMGANIRSIVCKQTQGRIVMSADGLLDR